MASIIKLRASAPTVQKALNLNDAEFGNLKVSKTNSKNQISFGPFLLLKKEI